MPRIDTTWLTDKPHSLPPEEGVVRPFGLKADASLGARLISIAHTAAAIHQAQSLHLTNTAAAPSPRLTDQGAA